MKWFYAVAILVLLGCGAESNVNSFFVSDHEGENFESLMENAQAVSYTHLTLPTNREV